MLYTVAFPFPLLIPHSNHAPKILNVRMYYMWLPCDKYSCCAYYHICIRGVFGWAELQRRTRAKKKQSERLALCSGRCHINGTKKKQLIFFQFSDLAGNCITTIEKLNRGFRWCAVCVLRMCIRRRKYCV